MYSMCQFCTCLYVFGCLCLSVCLSVYLCTYVCMYVCALFMCIRPVYTQKQLTHTHTQSILVLNHWIRSTNHRCSPGGCRRDVPDANAAPHQTIEPRRRMHDTGPSLVFSEQSDFSGGATSIIARIHLFIHFFCWGGGWWGAD